MTIQPKFLRELVTSSHNRLRRLVDGKECRVSNATSLYDIEDVDHRKQVVQMSKFKGKVLLIMNVAAKWSLTLPNYTQLPKLMEEFSSRGLEVLAFPCPQFQLGRVRKKKVSSWFLLTSDHVRRSQTDYFLFFMAFFTSSSKMLKRLVISLNARKISIGSTQVMSTGRKQGKFIATSSGNCLGIKNIQTLNGIMQSSSLRPMESRTNAFQPK